MRRINFNEISVKVVKRWTDENGKKRQKTKKFYQTINPYNRNTEGSVKTREEIWAEIMKESEDWQKSDEND